MKPVYLISPWRGDTFKHLRYATTCMKDSIARDESPFAPHLLYTQCLDDCVEDERNAGIQAGNTWMLFASTCVVYTDYGISEGMQGDIDTAKASFIPLEYRTLPYEELSKSVGINTDSLDSEWFDDFDTFPSPIEFLPPDEKNPL